MPENTEEAAEAVVEAAEEVVAEEALEVDVEALAEEVAEVAAPAKVTPAGGSAAAVGRRKEAVARVRIGPGSGEFRINGRTLDEYFPDKVHQQLINSPFAVLGSLDQYDVFATMSGGGTSGQAGALRLAIARALNEINEEAYRPDLKAAGYLSRDSRAKERKKYGLKKARKAPQYSKR
ncbi:30S ribosomal protein S9 [Candidatus Nanopelagicales bacterium]|nr:30S ribosomal protein S9 [Candidatus Nanopelagicales bacterium]